MPVLHVLGVNNYHSPVQALPQSIWHAFLHARAGGRASRASRHCGSASTADVPVRVQYQQRILFMHKPVDEEMGNQTVATMLYLDSESRDDISMYINCSGGDVRGPLSRV